MNTCDSCYFWEPDDGEAGHWGECLKAESNTGEPVDADSQAFALDGEYSNARLMTRPNFGCVMWKAEPKEMPF